MIPFIISGNKNENDILYPEDPLKGKKIVAAGFNGNNGAVVLTTLFVTHYNFLRQHMSLNYKPPAQLPELQAITTLQGKWAKILSLTA